MLNRSVSFIIVSMLLSSHLFAQQVNNNNIRIHGNAFKKRDKADTNALTLNDCLKYALKNQPALNQSYIDEAISRTNNAIALSTWLPQVNGGANLAHYFKSPPGTSSTNGDLMPQAGPYNPSTPSLSVAQNLFSVDGLVALKAARLNNISAAQNTASAKINLVSDVSKAFYNVLLSMAQVALFKEDTARLHKNQADAYNRYISGVVDKVDYKQAAISLNNSRSQLKTAIEAVPAKYAVLQQLMGFLPERKFTVYSDTPQMLQDLFSDTLANLDYEKRIEYQQLKTAKRLQRETTMYYQMGYLPSLYAFYNYNYAFVSNQFSNLYVHAYPYSVLGVQLNFPIFTGYRRISNIRKAQLQEERIDWDLVNIELTISAQYRQALANYKSNLYYLQTQSDNVDMAREVYNIVDLQYKEGIKAYLDVIIAESALQTSEVNYLNALYQLLESKIDLDKAMGDIPTNI